MKHTQGNVLATLLENAAGGSALDGLEALADARDVGGGALGVLGDGVVQASLGARRDVGEGLAADHGGEGNDSDGGELHFEG